MLGFPGPEGSHADENVVGVEGIERSMESYSSRIDGFRHIERDSNGPRNRHLPGSGGGGLRHGMNVQLTIDMGIQAILETELDNAFKAAQTGRRHRPRAGSDNRRDPGDDQSRPTFDLNQTDAANATRR